MSKQRESSLVADRWLGARPVAFEFGGIDQGPSIERQLGSYVFESVPPYTQGPQPMGDYGLELFSGSIEQASSTAGSSNPNAPNLHDYLSLNFESGLFKMEAFSAGLQSGIGFGSRTKPSLSESFQEVALRIARLISRKLAARLTELSMMEDGWDGESAKAVRQDVMLSTVTLLWRLQKAPGEFRFPFIAPTHDGYLLLDWTSPQKTLEAEAGPDGWSIVGTITAPGGPNEYFNASIGPDWTGVHRYYLWFCGETQVWPTE